MSMRPSHQLLKIICPLIHYHLHKNCKNSKVNFGELRKPKMNQETMTIKSVLLWYLPVQVDCVFICSQAAKCLVQ